MTNYTENPATEESIELFPFYCPACGEWMASTVTSDLTGWMRCSKKHKTVYRDGIPQRTTWYGFPVKTSA